MSHRDSLTHAPGQAEGRCGGSPRQPSRLGAAARVGLRNAGRGQFGPLAGWFLASAAMGSCAPDFGFSAPDDMVLSQVLFLPEAEWDGIQAGSPEVACRAFVAGRRGTTITLGVRRPGSAEQSSELAPVDDGEAFPHAFILRGGLLSSSTSTVGAVYSITASQGDRALATVAVARPRVPVVSVSVDGSIRAPDVVLSGSSRRLHLLWDADEGGEHAAVTVWRESLVDSVAVWREIYGEGASSSYDELRELVLSEPRSSVMIPIWVFDEPGRYLMRIIIGRVGAVREEGARTWSDLFVGNGVVHRVTVVDE